MDAIDVSNCDEHINIKHAVHFVRDAWKSVKQFTIVKYSCHAGIFPVPAREEAVVPDGDMQELDQLLALLPCEDGSS